MKRNTMIKPVRQQLCRWWCCSPGTFPTVSPSGRHTQSFLRSQTQSRTNLEATKRDRRVRFVETNIEGETGEVVSLRLSATRGHCIQAKATSHKIQQSVHFSIMFTHTHPHTHTYQRESNTFKFDRCRAHSHAHKPTFNYSPLPQHQSVILCVITL